MLTAEWKPYRLVFNFEARTSRAVMRVKDTYFIRVTDSTRPSADGIGEAPLFAGLSREDDAGYTSRLDRICREIDNIVTVCQGHYELDRCAVQDSSIRMGLETAFGDLENGGRGVIFAGSRLLDGAYSIGINGLVWMGDKDTMLGRIREKIETGFRCIKLKIGGIDFEDELSLLGYIRRRFPADILELRVDTNGAFQPAEALGKIERLSKFGIHSIEQPIRAGQYDEIARICAESPINVALDEELIGTTTDDFKEQLLTFIRPQYIILKPALCGGFADADNWIATARRLGIGSWATSALESNIGLNAIAQWTALNEPEIPQGLGTGALYTNNTSSQLELRGPRLHYVPTAERYDWKLI